MKLKYFSIFVILLHSSESCKRSLKFDLQQILLCKKVLNFGSNGKESLHLGFYVHFTNIHLYTGLYVHVIFLKTYEIVSKFGHFYFLAILQTFKVSDRVRVSLTLREDNEKEFKAMYRNILSTVVVTKVKATFLQISLCNCFETVFRII